LDFGEDEWQPEFMNQVATPGTTFHVNMAGFEGNTIEEMVLNEMNVGNTGWELRKLQEAGRLASPDTNFYLPGSTEPECNPF